MNIDAWTQAFTTALNSFWGKVASFLPNFLATIIIVIAGIYLSRLIAKALGIALQKVGTDSLCEQIGLTRTLGMAGIEMPPSQLLALLFRLFLILVIILTAAETLGLQRISAVVDEFVLYLPKMIGAIAVVMGGMFAGHHFKRASVNTLKHFDIDYAQAVSQVVYGVTLLITASLAINQLEISTALFDLFFVIILACIGLAVAISFGLGARDVSAQLISGIYLREQLLSGEILLHEGKEGKVLSVGTVNTLVQIDNQMCRIPNAELLKSQFTTRSEDVDQGSNI